MKKKPGDTPSVTLSSGELKRKILLIKGSQRCGNTLKCEM